MKRPDPLIPARPGAEDAEAMLNRVIWLDALYLHDGRQDRDHPMHGLYCGLWLQYKHLLEA
jgi:hypothetical protein